MSEPRSWYERRQADQRKRYPELDLADPVMVSSVDARRISRGELPSQMTQDTTRIAADIARAKGGDTSGNGFLSNLWPGARNVAGALLGPQVEQTGRLLEHLGRPAGAATAALAGRTPGESARGLVEGFRDPVEGVQRGRDAGFVRHLSDDPAETLRRGAGATPLAAVAARLGFSPRDIGGAAVPAVADPLNFVPGLGPTKQIVQGSRRANRAVAATGRAGDRLRKAAPFGGLDEAGDAVADARFTRQLEPDAPAPYEAPPTVRRLYGSRDIEEGAVRGRGERLAESGRFRADDPIVTPALRVRDESRQAVTNQATRVEAQARTAIKRSGFKFEGPPDAQRIPALAGIDPSVPGAPTLRDVMARRPVYEPHLTPQQRQSLDALGESLTPYRQGLDEVAEAEAALTGKPSTIKIGSRADVMEGGVYIPRGTAETEELADIAARRVGGGGRRAGGKQGFEKSATFASEAEGIEAGYRYTPVSEAMGGYVRGAGNRTLDRHTANYFISRVDDAGKRIAETRADRVDPGLRADVEALRTRISGRQATFGRRVTRQQAQERAAVEAERTAEGVEGIRDKRGAAFDDRTGLSTDEAIRAAERELDSLERAARQTESAADVSRGRAERTAMGAVDTNEELARFRAELDELSPRWRRAQEQAASTPRDQGTIPLAGLEAYSFPWEMADEATRILRSEIRGAAGDISGPLRAINSIARGVQATGEMSYLGIQMAIGMFSDPAGWARAGKAATRAWLNSGDEVMGSFVANFDQRAVNAGRPSSERWAASGLRLAESGTEFRVGGRKVPTKVQGVAESRAGRAATFVPRQLVKRADRGFGVAGDTMRLELADTLAEEALAKGRRLTDTELRTLAESANRVTGWTPQRAFGSWGEAANFAPRYLAARARAAGQLASTDPRKRQIARRLVGRYMAIGATMTIAINELSGEETDFRPFSGSKGPTFNPLDAEYKNPNFMRVINKLGRDWSLLGPMDALFGVVVGAGSLATNPTGDPEEILRRMRTVLSGPIASLGLDWLVFGESFEREPLDFDSRAGQMDLLQRVVPFAAPELVESAVVTKQAAEGGSVGGAVSEAVGGTLEGFVGGRGSALTPRERVLRGEFEELTPEKRFEAIAAESWRIMGDQESLKGMMGDAENVFQWRQQTEKDLREQLTNSGLQAGEVQAQIDSAVVSHPLYRAYLDLRTALRTQWVISHPAEAVKKWNADASKAWDDSSKWSPTKEQREIMTGWMRATGAPAEAAP
jgi:hypothetical protein